MSVVAEQCPTVNSRKNTRVATSVVVRCFMSIRASSSWATCMVRPPSDTFWKVGYPINNLLGRLPRRICSVLNSPFHIYHEGYMKSRLSSEQLGPEFSTLSADRPYLRRLKHAPNGRSSVLSVIRLLGSGTGAAVGMAVM